MNALSASVPGRSSVRRGEPSRRSALRALALSSVGILVVLTGCGQRESKQPPQLKGEALAAEIARLKADIEKLPHVTAVFMEYSDNITNGQGFRGVVDTDTMDQTVLDTTLDAVVRILWGTSAFYPGEIATQVRSKDRTQLGDYRTLGAADASGLLPEELIPRYGPPGFLLQTATTSASARDRASAVE